MWSLCFGGQFEGSLSGATGILAQGIKSRTRILCRIHSHFRLTVEHFLRACLPACLRAWLTHSLTHSAMHEGSKAVRGKAQVKERGFQGEELGRRITLSQIDEYELAHFPGAADVRWWSWWCLLLFTAASYTHTIIYIYKQMRIWFLAIISYSCASDSEQKLLSSSSCLLACPPTCGSSLFL